MVGRQARVRAAPPPAAEPSWEQRRERGPRIAAWSSGSPKATRKGRENEKELSLGFSNSPTRQSHGGCRRQGRLPTQDPAPLLGGGGWSTGHPRPEASPGPLCATAEVLNLFCFPHLQPRGDLASAVPPATEGRARRVCPGETLDFSKDSGNTDSPVERSPSHISSPPRSLSLKVSAVDSSGPTWVTDTVHIFPPSLPSRAL